MKIEDVIRCIQTTCGWPLAALSRVLFDVHSHSSLSEYVVSYGIQRWRRFILLSFFFGLKTCRTSVFCGLSLLLSLLLRNPRVFFISPRLKISICAMHVLFDLPGGSTPSNYLCKLRCQLSRRSDVLS